MPPPFPFDSKSGGFMTPNSYGSAAPAVWELIALPHTPYLNSREGREANGRRERQSVEGNGGKEKVKERKEGAEEKRRQEHASVFHFWFPFPLKPFLHLG